MGLSVTHLLLVVAVAFLLFGRGKISELMGDVGKGIRSFKKGLEEDDGAAKADVVAESVKPTAPGRSGLA
ncbi:preprotein translocase subunit TatA [Hyphomicrobium nitrativorans NL23]|uniref:Sec-independent protein translocase protein TatA n=1 Tax=Hyphomicrobium nitrativorans NL23 TaxID=1029756 RepID=V5SA80_9HYPH|nr:twin-arginine translocase TatA/TatE family subunit [Hyphomicrobium nitrativorans]AHB47548.1 preprotein translocase subunit TatA [Hyphomicrobium nitrativorans NL23]